MKPYHEKNGAAIYVGRAATVHNPLRLNILTGTFLLVSCSYTFQNLLWLCARSRPKKLAKKYNKEVCQAS